jgi:hypothetical protein
MKRIIIFLLTLLTIATAASAGKISFQISVPRYYTLEDLKSAARNYRSCFSFDNSVKPIWASVDLPMVAADSFPLYIASPRLERIRAQGWYQFLAFPWNSPSLSEGNLVFLRGGDTSSYLVRFFSSWSHVSTIYSLPNNQVFESNPSAGVNIYDYRNAWRNIVAYSVKPVNVVNPMQYVYRAVTRYAGRIQYYPIAVNTQSGMANFFNKWSDKMDLDSMYCSKLVWWTFRDAVDLDSNRTRSELFGGYAMQNTDYGSQNNIAWIGVSPDDIYYSRYLGRDIITEGRGWINEPLSDSIF